MAGQKAFIKEGETSIQYYTPEQEDLINQIFDKVSFDDNLPIAERMQMILGMINNPDKHDFFERKPTLQERPTAKSIDQIIQESNFIDALAPADKTNVEATYTGGKTSIERLLENPRILSREPIPDPDIM
jgi:hypothetical protein